MLKFILYLIRWQLSTPILAPIVAYFKHSTSAFGTLEDWYAAAVANLIGACIFFWVDRFIFKSKIIERWEMIDSGRCYDCGKFGLVRRLVIAESYDRRKDPQPQYRCMKCSHDKLEELKKRKAIGG